MPKKDDTIRLLTEISEQFGRNDKQIAISNLAHHMLGLLQGKEGRLAHRDQADVAQMAETVVGMGKRHFSLEEDLDKSSDKPKSLRKGGFKNGLTGSGAELRVGHRGGFN